MTLDPTTVTPDELERARKARTFVHKATCPTSHLTDHCVACSRSAGLVLALRALDDAPRDARRARQALHDSVCSSGCGPDSDHADRTQARAAAALRKFLAASGVL